MTNRSVKSINLIIYLHDFTTKVIKNQIEIAVKVTNIKKPTPYYQYKKPLNAFETSNGFVIFLKKTPFYRIIDIVISSNFTTSPGLSFFLFLNSCSSFT